MTDWFSEDQATFGDRMAAAREAAGMTPGVLAKRLGVREKTIRAWEDDMSEPRANRLQMLAGLLNVSIMWLLTGQGEGVSPPEEVPTADMQAALTDVRLMRAEVLRIADRLGHMEKRLRQAARTENA